jgi:phosphate-selective porin
MKGYSMKNFLLTLVFAFAIQGFLFAQDEQDSAAAVLGEKLTEVKGAVDGINETVLEMKSTVDALKKIKLSGYIQAQFQSIENDGAASFSGGNFSAGMHNRFLVRRGRLKVTYDNDLNQYVLQIDATEKGLGLKDAYIYTKDPWLKTFALKGGVFDRPFGFEISYSSSSREAPERSRIFQTLFPGERDLGASIEIFPTESPLSYFNFKGGLFAGNGVNVEVDNQKDFIGRLGFSLPFYEENLAIDGGVSGYMGKVKLAAGKYLYAVNSPTLALKDSTTNVPWADRNYIGFDLQVYYDIPEIGGFSLRGEYITGKQPGSSSSSGSPTALQTGDLYLRKFSGYYINYVQNLGDRNQLVVKYDVYDPNTSVSTDEIGNAANAKLGAVDLKYSTLGLGLVHYWDDNVKFVFYYDIVKNEKTSKIAAFKDDLKDNVFTFRIQYKF